MAAARRLGPPGSLRPVVVVNLIGLLYTTGLRIGEALNLTLRDIDLKRRVIEVREGKFRKSRYVPLSSSTARQMKEYLHQRRGAGFSVDPAAPVFLNIIGTRHGHPGFVTLFLELLRGLGLRGPTGQPGPRIHDLRHTCRASSAGVVSAGCQSRGQTPTALDLSGHCTITGTEIYLQATAQLLEQAGQRFHAYFAVPSARAKRDENI
jgi:integrase